MLTDRPHEERILKFVSYVFKSLKIDKKSTESTHKVSSFLLQMCTGVFEACAELLKSVRNVCSCAKRDSYTMYVYIYIYIGKAFSASAGARLP